jgi:transcriptional regulator with XRE-family HTH domain
MIKDINIKIGKRIAKLRKEVGLSQSQLAESIELSAEYISRLERGINAPSVEVMNKMSDPLKVEVRELLTMSEQETEDDWEIEIEALIVLMKNKKGKSIRKVFKLAEIVDE